MVEYHEARTSAFYQFTEPKIRLDTDIEVREETESQRSEKMWLNANGRAGDSGKLDDIVFEVTCVEQIESVCVGVGCHRSRRVASRIARRNAPAVVLSLQCSRVIARAIGGGQRKAWYGTKPISVKPPR